MARHLPRQMVRSQRSNVWLFWEVNPVVVAAASSVLVASLNAAALALRPFTVIRTHLVFHAETDQSAASELNQGAMGMVVVSDQASATGAGATPNPIGNADAPWFVYQPWIDSFLLGDATGFIESTGIQYDVDSKAMRKVGINEDIIMEVENGSAAAGATITVQGRVLVKLH